MRDVFPRGASVALLVPSSFLSLFALPSHLVKLADPRQEQRVREILEVPDQVFGEAWLLERRPRRPSDVYLWLDHLLEEAVPSNGQGSFSTISTLGLVLDAVALKSSSWRCGSSATPPRPLWLRRGRAVLVRSSGIDGILVVVGGSSSSSLL